MDSIHKDAIPILTGTKQVGWQYENKDFLYQAIQSVDNRIDVYILWGDDQPADVTWFIDWEGARRYLSILLGSSG